MRRLLAPLAILLVLVSCGSDDDDSDRADTLEETTTTSVAEEASTTTSEPEDADSGPVTQEALSGALLTVDDLPSGWAVSPPDEDEDDDDFCEDAPKYRQPVMEAEVEFQESDFGPFAFEAIGTYDDASAYMDEIRAAVEACRDFTETDEDGSESKGSFQPLSFPKFGEETFATRLSGEGGGFPFSGDIVIVRLDDELVMMIGSLAVMGGGVDDFEDLVRKAVDRAEQLT